MSDVCYDHTTSTHNALTTYASTADALEHEKHLLKRVSAGRLDKANVVWSANQCLVVPYKFRQHAGFAEACKVSAASGWPVHVRQTGGGVTPQGPGILNVSLAFANRTGERLSITQGYRLVCDPIIAELAELGVTANCSAVDGAFCDGDYNVVVGGKKLVGTAQRLSRVKEEPAHQAILIHALILYETDLQQITAAVNRFGKALQTEEHFSSSAHCNLVGVCPEYQLIPTQQQFAQQLLLRYQVELNQFNDR